MLRKLKFKIVFTNMLLVFVLLLVVAIATGLFVYRFEYEKIDNRLKQSILFLVRAEVDFKRDIGEEFDYNHDKDLNPPTRNTPDKDNFLSGSAVAVFVDENGNILLKGEFSATMSDEALSYSIAYALDSNKSTGRINAAKLMYRKIESEQGICISFTDYEEAINLMQTFLLFTGGCMVLVMAIVFVISIIVASLSIKPVRNAWNSQKQFIADASHELKTPLTVILANNNILQSHPENTIDDQMQWVESTQQEAQRMKQLVEQMLYLAKAEADTVPLQLAETNISDMVERDCLVFETVAFENGVMFETEITENVTISTDSQLLERVVYILIDNAVKHASNNTSISISLKKEAKSITLKVNNKGDIIPPDDLPHIFDRFYKADKSRTIDNADNGFGLGLSIAKSIVTRLHGNINVTSTEEQGTTFTVEMKNER